MKIAFLLGAGFSKYFGLPLANELVTRAKLFLQNKNLLGYSPSRKSKVFERLLGFAEHVASTKNINSFDIEQILEAADNKSLIALSNDDPWLGIGTDIRYAIFETFVINHYTIFNNSKKYEIFDSYLRFLDLIDKTGYGPLISINYDSIPELLLKTAAISNGNLSNQCAARIRFSYGIGSDFQALDIGGPVANIRYFKLHGSYNWEKCDKHGFQENTDVLRTRVRGVCRECKSPTKPYIIYPELRKQKTEELNKLWIKCKELLSTIDKLVVIGVRFNTYDKDLYDLVNELSRKIQIIIIDPNASLLAKKFDGSALPITNRGKNGSCFEDIFASKSSDARNVFEDAIGVKIRNLSNFTTEKPPNPFFEEPIIKDFA